MTVNERIISALGPLGYPVVPDLYTGSEAQYFTFNETTHGALFTNDLPAFESHLVQVHFFCPYTFDSVEIRNKTKKQLISAGFTWPEVVNATGDYREANVEGQHYVFECEIEGGVVLDG